MATDERFEALRAFLEGSYVMDRGLLNADLDSLEAELHQRDETIKRLEHIEEAARAHVNQPNNSLTFQGLIDALSVADLGKGE